MKRIGKVLESLFSVWGGETRLESSVIQEKDARSTSSLSYDDIDKNDETLAQPLTSGTHSPTASDSEDSYVNNTAPQSEGKFWTS